jgi:hypothetical protein
MGGDLLAGTEWKRIEFKGTADKDYAVGAIKLEFFAGFQVQSYEVAGLALVKDNFTTGIDNFALQNPTVYPNPCYDHFYLKGISPANGKVTVTLTSGMGQTIIAKDVPANSPVNISALPAGLYLVRVQQGDSDYFQKLIKTKF